jgi:hypothetical protein
VVTNGAMLARVGGWSPGSCARCARRSAAVAVQVVTKQGRQVLGIEHVGAAHSDEDLALLIADANARLAPGQDAFDLGDVAVVPTRMDDVADWTLPLDKSSWISSSASARSLPGVGGGVGRVVSTSSLLLWQVLASAYSGGGQRRGGT